MKTKQLRLCALFFAVAFISTAAHAQSSTSPDSVCAGETGQPYYVTATAGSTYYWIVPYGTIISGNNTDSIDVDWSSTPGTDTISVVEVTAHSCVGDTQRLVVYRMPLPEASLAGVDSVCYNSGSSFQVSFTGIGPWNFTYSDGTNLTALTNITSNPYTVGTGNLTANTKYTIKAVSNKFGCAGSAIGTGNHKVVVNAKPVTSAIFHN